MAWAERYHFVELFYWDGSQWIYVTNTLTYTETGVHQSMEDRTISMTFDRNWYGAPPAIYIMCGMPYFDSNGGYGTWTCGDNPPAWTYLF